jgi:hypothetical protein
MDRIGLLIVVAFLRCSVMSTEPHEHFLSRRRPAKPATVWPQATENGRAGEVMNRRGVACCTAPV